MKSYATSLREHRETGLPLAPISGGVLPQVVAATCKEKVIQPNGDVLISFWIKTGEDQGKDGYLRIVVPSAVAADFPLNTEFTWTATAGD